jgi:gamma-butyrobetaine dioxygenase
VVRPAVTEPVRLHVTAKRYLCHVEPKYLAGLSPISHYTLEVQSRPMTSTEARTFEEHSYSAESVALRRFDDLAKDPPLRPPPFEDFAPLLEELLGPLA